MASFIAFTSEASMRDISAVHRCRRFDQLVLVIVQLKLVSESHNQWVTDWLMVDTAGDYNQQ